MKQRIYLRVAKKGQYGRVKVAASIKSSEDPIYSQTGYGSKEALPTVGFAVDFEIPDQLFSKASVVVATINIATKDAAILTGLPVVVKKVK